MGAMDCKTYFTATVGLFAPMGRSYGKPIGGKIERFKNAGEWHTMHAPHGQADPCLRSRAENSINIASTINNNKKRYCNESYD